MLQSHRLAGFSVLLVVFLFAPSAWDSTVLGRGAGDAEFNSADSSEPDDLPAQASTITPGDVQEHTFHVEGDEDWAKFPVIAGHRYTIYTSRLDVDVDTILELWGINAAVMITTNDDEGGDVWSRIVFTATETGFYYVKVREHDTSITGKYSLTLARSPGVYLNTDQNADVLTYKASNGTWARQLSNGTGGFVQSLGTWPPGWSVLPGRFDADPQTDAFTFNTTTGAWAKEINDGSGFVTTATGTWWPGWQRFVLNLDDDNISDLFLYDPVSGAWFKCISTETGFTYEQGYWSPGWEIYPMALNVDQLTDMFIINRDTGQWYWVFGDPLGFSYPASAYWAPNWAIYPGDFNGDGRTDLFLYDSAAGTHYVALTGDTGYTYAAGAGWAAGWTPWVMDLNGDGFADVFLYGKSTGRWFELQGDGGGELTVVGEGWWTPDWDLYPTDLNGDGRADLLLYDPPTGNWYTARNLTIGSFSYDSGTWAPGLQVIVRPPIR